MFANCFNKTTWPWLAFLGSAGLLLGALAFEHIGGMAPCQMCYWQRHAHKAVLILAIAALLARYMSKGGRWDTAFILLIGLAFTISFGLAFWHVGVEYKWWEGPKSCMASKGPIDFDPETLFSTDRKMPACSDAPWDLFNISMAGYNAAISGIAALLSFVIGLGGKRS